MRVVVKIPDEFIREFNQDKFFSSFSRVITDIGNLINDKMQCSLSGKYEKETLEMLRKAFLDGCFLDCYTDERLDTAELLRKELHND